MNNNKLIIFIILLSQSYYCFGNNIDSLKNLLTSQADTNRIQTLIQISAAYEDSNFEISTEYAYKAYNYALNINNKEAAAQSLNTLGNIYHRKALYNKAIEFYNQAYDIFTEINFVNGISSAQNNLGTAFLDKGEYAKALEYLLKAARMYESENSLQDLAISYNNIGLIYFYQKDYKKALVYYNKALVLRKQFNNQNGIALAYNNIGIIYYYISDYEKVLEYFEKALKIYQEQNNLRGQSLPLYNIGEIYFEQARYNEALSYYNKSLEIDRKIGDRDNIAVCLFSIGKVYSLLNNNNKAIKIQKEGLQIAQSLGARQTILEGYLNISETYEKKGDFRLSLKYYKLHSELKDSIYNLDQTEKLAEVQAKYEIEKKEERISYLETEQKLKELELKQNQVKISNQKNTIYLTAISLLLIVIFIVILVTQIRQKQKTNLLLRSTNKKINKQNQQLEKAFEEINKISREKEKFFATTSHELRNPLNIVIGFTKLLLITKLNKKQQEYLQNINRAGKGLLVVINDILTHSKIEAGKLELELIDFEFIKEINTLVNIEKQNAEQKNITIDVSFGEKIPKYIKGDPIRLNQILSNLISNAIKFTPENGKIFLIVKVLSQDLNDIIFEFTVSDNGIGIDKSKLHIIFESYTQASHSTTRKYGGTGLGLSIVKRLVEMHYGKIQVDSTINKGTTFKFTLNYKRSFGLENTEETNDSTKKNIHKNIRILLVEDDPLNATLAIDTFLTFDSNLHIDHAEDGEIALKIFRNNDYDLIFMDIQIPKKNGFEVTQEIRKDFPDTKKDIPIIGMSGFANQQDIEYCISIGMNDVINKPFVPSELFNKLKKWSQDYSRNIIATNNNFNKTTNLDISVLLNIYTNKYDKLLIILKTYQREVPQKLQDLQSSYSEKSFDITKNIAHSLKTSFKYIGAYEASNICLVIEKEALKNEINLDQQINDLMDNWQIISKELQEIIQKTEIKKG